MSELAPQHTEQSPDIDVEVSVSEVPPSLTEQTPPAKKKRQRKEPAQGVLREEGKSLFPFSRVQKIIKADKVSQIGFPECIHHAN